MSDEDASDGNRHENKSNTFGVVNNKTIANGHLAYDSSRRQGTINLPKTGHNSAGNKVTKREVRREKMQRDTEEEEMYRAGYAKFNNDVNSTIEKINLEDFFASVLSNKPNINTTGVRFRPIYFNMGVIKDIWPKARVPMTLHNIINYRNHNVQVQCSSSCRKGGSTYSKIVSPCQFTKTGSSSIMDYRADYTQESMSSCIRNKQTYAINRRVSEDLTKTTLCYSSKSTYDNVKHGTFKNINAKSPSLINTRPQIRGIARMTRRELEQYHQDLFNNLPKYTKEEILAARCSHDSNLLSNLQNDGFPLAALFIQRMIQMDNDRRKFPHPYKPFGPELKDYKPHLERLDDNLRAALEACKFGEYGFSSEMFLEMAIVFMRNEVWWWLAEQMFEVSIFFGQKMKSVSFQAEMTARCTFGGFLFNDLHRDEDAEAMFKIVMSNTKEKPWKVKDVHKKEESLFCESTNLLSKLYLKRCTVAMSEQDFDKAMGCLCISHKFAMDSGKRRTLLDVRHQELQLVRMIKNFKTTQKMAEMFINKSRNQ